MPDDGDLTVDVTARESADAIEIRICDSGRGMEPEVAARSTEAFFTTHQPRRGRGLGLSAANGFARQCGGTLAITSAPGKGTTVSVTLPAAGQR